MGALHSDTERGWGVGGDRRCREDAGTEGMEPPSVQDVGPGPSCLSLEGLRGGCAARLRLRVNPGPSLLLPRGNLLPNLTAADMKTCRFHPDKAPFCPILRVGDVVKFAGQDFPKLASTVST